MTENDKVRDTISRARAWLAARISEQPNRDSTSWRVGRWNVETSYMYGEGILHLWTDEQWPGRKVITRGRGDNDAAHWIALLEECQA